MEVVGAAASVIAITTLVKDLIELCNKLKGSLDKVSMNRLRLQDLAINIVDSLAQLEALIKDRQYDLDARRLRQSLSSLDSDLRSALANCERLAHPKSRFGKIGVAFEAWKDGSNIEAKISRIEAKINNCFQLFWVAGTARVELSLDESSRRVDRFRSEVNDRLDKVEIHLRNRVEEAEGTGAKARELLGVQHMTRRGMKRAIRQASLTLESNAVSALETQYLRTMVKTLTEAVENTPHKSSETPDLSKLPESTSPSTYRTHYGKTGDSNIERQDAVMDTLRILRLLRSEQSIFTSMQVSDDLNSLSTALLDIGMYEDALDMYSQLVEIHRKCGSSGQSTVAQFQLARSLIGASVCFKQLGDSQTAFSSANEAILIFRSLVNSQPDAFVHHLALALQNAANYLKDIRRHAEALQFTREAIHIRRALVRSSPIAHKPDLAASLLCESSCLSKQGHKIGSLLSIEEAVAINRTLANERPDLFAPHFAASLHNYAMRLADLGRHKQAASEIKEALKIRRGLAQTRPEVFNPGLARSLVVASSIFGQIQQYADSLTMMLEGIDVLRLVVRQRPEVHTASLAESMADLATLLLSLGRFNEAARSASEAVEIYNPLVSQRPTHYREQFDRLLDVLQASRQGQTLFDNHVQQERKLNPQKYFAVSTAINNVPAVGYSGIYGMYH